MYAETFACRGLATGRRSGNEHHLDAFVFGYLVGNLRNFLLLQGFRHLNEVRRAAPVDDFVQVADISQVHDVLPLVVFLEDAEHLVLADEGSELGGVIAVGDAQQQTVEVVFQSEEVDLRRVSEQRAVVIVLIAVDVVIGGVEASGAL